MSDAEDKELALEELVRLVRPSSAPTLTSNELEDVLDQNQRARRWSTSLTLAISEVVMPTVRNGHIYRVVQSGTTGSTEPTWPTGEDDTVVDGTATLIEAGVDFANVYNIRGAAEECWALKERRAITFSLAGDTGFTQVVEQCREERKSLASVLIA